MLFLVHVIFLVCFTYIKCELALPSYDLDSGEWPTDLPENDRIVENLMDRWFIDKKDAKCKPFEYRGTKGNFNNFPSQKLCERHLNAELTQVEKLLGCDQKPSGTNEHHGACTDNTNDVIEKFYFNKDDGTCTSYNYNKCGGTFNRYDSEDECKAYCLNDKNGKLTSSILSSKLSGNDSKYTLPNYLDCHLKPDVKTHNPATKVIALVKEKKCVYASVDTSLERGYFHTLRACVAKCFPHSFSDTDDTNQPEIQRRVQACNSDTPKQYETNGSNDLIKYYYHKTDNKCKRFETGPKTLSDDNFDSSLNNFPTLDLCHSYCGTGSYPDEITTEKTCQMPKTGEIISSTTPNPVYKVKRYYYMEANSGADKKCVSFYYSGIEGNTNNFKTFTECQKICGENMRPGDTITEDNTATTTNSD